MNVITECELLRHPGIIHSLKYFNESLKDKLITIRCKDDGAFGEAFENKMKVERNNSNKADFKGVEYKTKSSKDTKISLMQKSLDWINKHKIIRKFFNDYGIYNTKTDWSLYSTVTTNENSHGFKLHVNNDVIILMNKRKELGQITAETFNKRINEKLRILVQAIAERLPANKVKYTELYAYYNVGGGKDFIELISCGDVILELMMSDRPINGFHNHGYAWRINPKRLCNLYQSSIQIA